MKTFLILLACTLLVFSVQSAPDPRQKRSHNHGPHWLDNCWDHGLGHNIDPLCDLLTEPTTTTTTTLPPTTTPRSCDFEVHKDRSIQDTDYAAHNQGISSTNATLNQVVHVTTGDVVRCMSTCTVSLLQDNFECWAFTYNASAGCYLYYYSRPLGYVPSNLNFTGTTLYLKRCSDDPFGSTPTRSTPTPTTTLVGPVSPSESPHTVVSTITQTTSAASGTSGAGTSGVTGGTGGSSGGNGVISNPGGGVVMINTNTFRINGVPSPEPGKCFFFNKAYSLGEIWKDTCKYNCTCVDTAVNAATCTDICPVYRSIPSNCKIVKLPTECCNSLNCTNSTDTTVGPTVNGTDCVDQNDTCNYYPDSGCKGKFVPWARAHCPLRCDFCPGKAPPCQDAISYCDRFDMDDACNSYEGWARSNCRQSCSKCTAPGWNPDGINRITGSSTPTPTVAAGK